MVRLSLAWAVTRLCGRADAILTGRRWPLPCGARSARTRPAKLLVNPHLPVSWPERRRTFGLGEFTMMHCRALIVDERRAMPLCSQKAAGGGVCSSPCQEWTNAEVEAATSRGGPPGRPMARDGTAFPDQVAQALAAQGTRHGCWRLGNTPKPALDSDALRPVIVLCAWPASVTCSAPRRGKNRICSHFGHQTFRHAA